MFIVIEIQKTGDQIATLVNSYAAKSGLDRHSAPEPEQGSQ